MADDKGAYLTFDNASNGSLFIVWRKEKVDNALMFIRPTKAVAEFKFSSNSGKSELIRNLQSDKKLFFSGLCQFIKEARDIKGVVTLLSHFNDTFPIKVNVYFLKGNNVVPLSVGVPFDLDGVDAVSVLPQGSSSLQVKTMKKDMFVSRGNSEGASVSF
ncbi:conserved Plasmodium protein, unknown function [Plasmodium vivax]|uniref:IMP1-like protein n=6 Tax=Plasmodium vivax TaxID=5855 RepID=A5KA24_PLAVS|nr:hypothetical protein, conserved [Plasmodium vivax]KMZ82816.1 hypothetical protein PVIIG_03631 [Plasmodium vivax India VII]KMZ89313.1 hypothetical protein PVBG_03663 [Plasmodium vivax Brazil I]KMZ95477.1 hypothetical protein PVMG_05784 [Plasmodium vivax Mauritania I]KNA01994.1 hypothetical protein PVNG_04417 [Plasmodium vivax North Korean]EDL43912.1 hypothetical protein, conserved [Plasmodium vivax]|eukprot:XP_001613639.1 hypothetical protein [Plasmodium vivax Sal-1]